MQRGQAGPVSAIPRGTLTQTGVAEISNKGALHPVTPAGPKHIFLLPSYLGGFDFVSTATGPA